MRYLLFVLFALALTGCAGVSRHNPIQADHTVTPTASIEQAATVAPETAVGPIVAEASSPPPPLPVVMPFTEADVRCLAEAMYYEARGEGDKGMAAVGYVVTNRKDIPKTFAPTICGVVYQGNRDKRGHLKLHQCQFGWACDGHKHPIVDRNQYEHCQDLAKLVLLKMAPNPVGRATHFHATSERVSRSQARSYATIVRIGHQVYYRPKGDQFVLAVVATSS